MNIKTKQRIPIVTYLVAAIVVGCILFISWLLYLERYEGAATSPDTISDFGDKHFFAINPESILVALDRGEKDVFTPEIATPEAPIFKKTVEWHQADYLKIASALNQFVWNQNLEGWSLYYMDFNVACHDNPNGFELAEIAYFKTIPYDVVRKEYTVHAFQIAPQYGYVITSGGANFPQPLFEKWKSVNLNNLKVPAEDALKIADENGGRSARLSLQNQCTINMRLSGNAGWNVFIYANDTGSSIFRMEVDAYTGKTK